MADYPANLIKVLPAREPWRDKLLVSESRIGGFRGRRLAPAKKRDFVFDHVAMTAADRTMLSDFYDANRSGIFNFWWRDAPGVVYVVAFSDEDGLDWRRSAGGYWEVTVKLSEI